MFAIGTENQLLYGITLLTGGIFALALGAYRCTKANLSRKKILLTTLSLPVFVTFFSHFLYCLADSEYILYSHSLLYFFAFWEKGTMLYGGILGAVLGLFLLGKKDFPTMLEQYAPSGALMIAAFRIAEGFLGQGYGEYAIEDTFFCRFPFMIYDPHYEAWAWALFVLEALIALGLFLFLLIKKERRTGDSALLLLGLYASAQIILESLRRDEFLRWGFVRIEQVLSAVLILVVLTLYCRKTPKAKTLPKLILFGVYLAMIVFCLLLEFATEGRIPFLLFLDVDACYIAMALACIVLGGCVLGMRRLSRSQYMPQGKERCI